MASLVNNFKEGGELKGQNHKTPGEKLYHISNHHIFFLTSMQVFLEPHSCLFCVLLSDMLNVSKGTFS